MVTTLFRGAQLVPMDGPDDAPCGAITVADVRIDGDRITTIAPRLVPRPGERVRDVGGLTMLPGFVQGHVHFCQTLFRGMADDLPLLRWLREWIWPLEAAHDAASVRISAELTVAELLRGGTTTVQAIETVRHTEQTFEVADAAGLTAIVGNCLMDRRGDGVPDGLAASAAESLQISDELRRTFDGRGRLRYAVSPRFLLSCSDQLARDAAAFADEHRLRVHTHASEHPDEVAAVRAEFGRDALEVLADQGLLGPRTGLAHCVHLSDEEVGLLAGSGAAVLHCPTANLKLGSGLAPVARYDQLGVRIALGADGAPCNNRLSALSEVRQAALVQALRAGPGAWPAERALWALTRGGAAAVGLDDVGAIRVGMRADLVLVDLEDPDLGVAARPVAKLVYGASERHIRHVVVGGRDAVRDGQLLDVDPRQLAASGRERLDELVARSGLAR